MKPSLASIWTSTLRDMPPKGGGHIWLGPPEGTAYLFWGKAARATSQLVRGKGPRLVISPENGDHPLPGKRSLRSGLRLLQFFHRLRSAGTRELVVYLSGGASSLAWLRPAGLSQRDLLRRLERLYRQPLTIRQLNRSRARLCLLKGGGALRLLRGIAPRVRVRVYVISDVAPFGLEVVGSGPFVGAPHFLLADNRRLVQTARKRLRSETLLDLRHSQTGSEKKWALALEKKIARALRLSQSGVLIWGGEPQIAISKKSKGKGGRQTQIAARLALRFWREILQGRVEILCASSDGRDGTSGSAATRLNARVLRSMNKLGPSLQRQLKKAIARYDTAPFLERHGALIAAYSTGTNLQDIVLIRINPSTNP